VCVCVEEYKEVLARTIHYMSKGTEPNFQKVIWNELLIALDQTCMPEPTSLVKNLNCRNAIIKCPTFQTPDGRKVPIRTSEVMRLRSVPANHPSNRAVVHGW
jgi:hypothetical protein